MKNTILIFIFFLLLIILIAEITFLLLSTKTFIKNSTYKNTLETSDLPNLQKIFNFISSTKKPTFVEGYIFLNFKGIIKDVYKNNKYLFLIVKKDGVADFDDWNNLVVTYYLNNVEVYDQNNVKLSPDNLTSGDLVEIKLKYFYNKDNTNVTIIKYVEKK